MDNSFIETREHARYAHLTLLHPPLNILNIAMLKRINDYLESLSSRKTLCALLIDAQGPAFSAGVDIPEHRIETVAEMLGTFHQTIRLLHRLPMPVVAAVHGGTYGGGMELAAFCDIVLASDDLKIGVPEITLGVYPPVAVALLTQVIGYRYAAEMILTGQVIGAKVASDIGLVNHVYPASQFRNHVSDYMEKFTRLSAYSLGQTRRALRDASWSTFEAALKASETSYLDELMKGSDPVEGLTAFMEKRQPQWLDR